MKNSVSSRKELTILKIEEEVFDFRHSACFRQTIEGLLLHENSRNLIIDLSQVKAIDSSGISSMLIAHQLSNQSQGLAIFVSLCQQIKDLLKLTNLDKQLYIFSSINEVMTLIEPAMKNKRGGRGKAHVHVDEVIDDICDEIALLDDVILPDDSIEDDLAGETPDGVEGREAAEHDPDQECSGPQKKRGRPKKSETAGKPGPGKKSAG